MHQMIPHHNLMPEYTSHLPWTLDVCETTNIQTNPKNQGIDENQHRHPHPLHPQPRQLQRLHHLLLQKIQRSPQHQKKRININHQHQPHLHHQLQINDQDPEKAKTAKTKSFLHRT